MEVLQPPPLFWVLAFAVWPQAKCLCLGGVRGPWGLVLDVAPFPFFSSLWHLTLVPAQRAGLQDTQVGLSGCPQSPVGLGPSLAARSATAFLRHVCVCSLGELRTTHMHTQEHTGVHTGFQPRLGARAHRTLRSAHLVGFRGWLADPLPLRAAQLPGLHWDRSLRSRFIWGVH